MKKIILSIVTAIGIMAMIPTSVSAHCDTMDGPTVADGRKQWKTIMSTML